MSGTDDVRRRRAEYRAMHRGTKEMDWILGRFAQSRIGAMNEADLARFERLLAQSDPDLQSWFNDPSPMAGSELAADIEAIRAFHGLA